MKPKQLTTKVFITTTILLFIFNASFAQFPEMVLVEGGSFSMGSSSEDLEETPVHKVTLNSFYVSKYEVTNKNYRLFCLMAGIKVPVGSEDMPVLNINWNDAVKYCNWLSDMEGLDHCYTFLHGKKFRARFIEGANGYRLLTEAEWEYAARGGKKSTGGAYSGSGNAEEVGWLEVNSKLEIHKGGLKKANELGIYDMTGNCLEWCNDWYSDDYYKKSPESNPTGEDNGSQKSCRGGNFNSSNRVSTNTNRLGLGPELEDHFTGLRIGKTKE